MVYLPAILFLLATLDVIALAKYPTPCDSDIYCRGAMLHEVQMRRLYKDSKHFVDMSMKTDPQQVKLEFEQLMNKSSNRPNKLLLKNFVENNFFEPGSELLPWKPSDWKPNPAFLEKIKDVRLRKWFDQLHDLWKVLGRRVSGSVFLHPERYSMIFVPNPVIIPGGRFREFYYWDSYWVMKGLLLSDMDETVRGMIMNFISMVKRYGFVPNGGRIYYTRRSQPPYLIPMFRLYYEKSRNIDMLRTILPYLEQEFEFWKVNRTAELQVGDNAVTLYRYKVDVGEPRPESYREDFLLANRTKATDEEREELYADLKTAAESGWDFSTRWFRVGDGIGGPSGSLKDLDTRNVVPVDLNALMYDNAKHLAHFHDQIKNEEQRNAYDQWAESHKQTMNQVLWDDQAGSWFDYDIRSKKLNKRFYPSNIFPIWVGASSDEQNQKFLIYLSKTNATSAASGVPTSMAKSGEQWDHPNGWPPLQHVMVEALTKINDAQSHKMALQLAQKWINTNFISFMEAQPHAMFEKYNVDQVGLPGGGGEYDVQVGFGWTNGVAMAFGDMFGGELVAPPTSGGALSAALPWLMLAVPLASLLLSQLITW